jgi:hypothetical protein
LRFGTPVAVWGQAFERGAAEHGLQPTVADETMSRRGLSVLFRMNFWALWGIVLFSLLVNGWIATSGIDD